MRGLILVRIIVLEVGLPSIDLRKPPFPPSPPSPPLDPLYNNCYFISLARSLARLGGQFYLTYLDGD